MKPVLRNAAGLSQKDFADTYRIPLSSLCNHEQGQRTPSEATRNYYLLIERYPRKDPRNAFVHPRMKLSPARRYPIRIVSGDFFLTQTTYESKNAF